MLDAIHSCQKIIQYCTYNLLLKPDVTEFEKEEIYYNIDDVRHTWNELEERYPIVIGPEIRTKKIVVYNSLTFTRIEVITVIVSTPNVEVSISITQRRILGKFYYYVFCKIFHLFFLGGRRQWEENSMSGFPCI